MRGSSFPLARMRGAIRFSTPLKELLLGLVQFEFIHVGCSSSDRHKVSFASLALGVWSISLVLCFGVIPLATKATTRSRAGEPGGWRVWLVPGDWFRFSCAALDGTWSGS